MSQPVFIPVTEKDQIREVERLARDIMMEHYSAYIPVDHIDFFLRQFQTAAAIEAQINSHFDYFLIQVAGKDVGYVGLEKKGEVLVISKLYVHYAETGKGYGKAALAFIDQYAQTYPFQRLELFVNIQNPHAIKVYKAAGFQSVEIQEIVYANGHAEHDWLMRKMLKT